MIKKTLALIAGLLMTTVFAADNTQLFNNFFTDLKLLTADFTQTTFDATNSIINQTSGKLFLDRQKQKLRWQTDPPNPQTLIINKKIWLIDPLLEQVIIHPPEKFQNTPLYSLLSKNPQFKFHKKSGKITWFKNQNTKLAITQNRVLSAISFTTNLEQTNIIKFTNITTPKTLPPNTFTPKIPKTFDIIF